MADEALLQILQGGVDEWNEWRRQEEEDISPDIYVELLDLSGAYLPRAELRGADLSGADLSGARLSGANLTGAELSNAVFSGAVLSGARLTGAHLSKANLTGAHLSNANLDDAWLYGANLFGANLTGASLSGADLTNASLSGSELFDTNLSDTNLSGASLARARLIGARLSHTRFDASAAGHTVFSDLDLRGAEGLETLRHFGPSEVGISTIYKSEGKIPEVFLRGCGIPESLIVQIPSLVASLQPLQFYSCFISYSGKDEGFARRLHSRMREAELRVWFAPEDMKGGDKLYDQIDRAIQVHDRLLLVLSESSLQSKWVEMEIRHARQTELREGRRKLFPIRLVSYEALQEWVCIDSTTGEDLAEEVRGYFIPDFSNWKNHEDLEEAFARLLAYLKASA